MTKRTNKLIVTLALASTLSGILAGCGSSSANATPSPSDSTVKQDSISPEQDEFRIIPLSVALVDIMGELGIDMVGVPDSQYTLHSSATGIPTVGLPMAPDMEKVLLLDPTHVVALTTLRSMVDAGLTAGGIEPMYVNLENIDELKNTITTIGNTFGKSDEAQQLIAAFDKEINEILASVQDEDEKKVLILFGFPGNYMIATNLSFVGQMTQLLGATNSAGDQDIVYVQMNLEELLVQDADVILRLAHGDKDVVIDMFDTEFATNPLWAQFSAVQNGEVYDLDDSMFNVSATLDTPEALRYLADLLYN